MNAKHRLFRSIGRYLPSSLSILLAAQSRHFRHFAQPGTTFVFGRYLGKLSVLIDTVYPIELEMLTGRYDRDSSSLIERLLQKDWINIDVGANVGALTLLMATMAPEGRVIAIEPGPSTCARLRQNLALNGAIASLVDVFQVGVSNVPGVLFWGEDENNKGNAGLLGKEGTAVEVTTIDEIVQRLELKRVDFVKIDVEGMEYEVIAGSLRSIEKFRPIFYYETLEAFRSLRGFDLYGKVYALLNDAGYRHFAVMSGTTLEAIDGLDHLKSSNVLAVPVEKTSGLGRLTAVAVSLREK
ncbi:FkbM family methyltransferase [Rubrivivax sp. A210]|uniref:FkbM family methyltransferase n=1 Tax=Rubrivivax sp. A210 TaxID=2772301 RepID=UPI001918DF11|nr:FkbM family methyltransferase [Rubrivivax sp. A210]CAD5373366.1 FkbM family methyltransferase [Rubrivivax sp. A210]